MKTLVIQSYRETGVPVWIQRCLESVRGWAVAAGYDYEFVGDEIFDMVPEWYRENAGHRPPVITDLGRLLLAEAALARGVERCIWLDADVFVFDPSGLRIDTGLGYAFGRELWVQPAAKGGLKVYRNVHNAVSVFEAGNRFLDFYIHAAEHIIRGASGSVPNQVVGTKFLTAVHNIMGFNLIDAVGMTSPLVIRDLAGGGGPALERLRAVTPAPLAAVNICSSLVGVETDGVDVSEAMVTAAMDGMALLQDRRASG
ncbi:MAG: hypothetical protein OXR84_09865 [Magnetovibrio sp.]|nr:hypothetical protein [Magnetovibrio sp.]